MAKSEEEIKEEILEYFVSGASVVILEIGISLGFSLEKYRIDLESYRGYLQDCLNEYPINLELTPEGQILEFRNWLKTKCDEQKSIKVFKWEDMLFVIGRLVQHKINISLSYILDKIKRIKKKSQFQTNLMNQVDSFIDWESIKEVSVLPQEKERDYFNWLKYLKFLNDHSIPFKVSETSLEFKEEDIQSIHEAMQVVMNKLISKTSESVTEKHHILNTIYFSFIETQEPKIKIAYLELFIRTAAAHRGVNVKSNFSMFQKDSETTSIQILRKELAGKLSAPLQEFINNQIDSVQTKKLASP